MEKKTVSKIQTVSFLGAAGLAWVVTGILVNTLAALPGMTFLIRLQGNDLFKHGLPISIAIATFLYLQMNPRILAWAELVIMEISKVVWPSRKDTTGMTIVTLVMLLISCVVLVTFDWIAGAIIGAIMTL